jgi:hypothetical protein
VISCWNLLVNRPAKLKCGMLRFRQDFYVCCMANLNICCKWSYFVSFLLLQLCVSGEHWIVPERWEVIVSFMNSCCMCFSTGQAFDKICNFFCRLILSSLSSCFTSFYMMKWKEYFPSKELVQPPRFEAEFLCYPKPKIVCDYLSWRQAECESFLLKEHIFK